MKGGKVERVEKERRGNEGGEGREVSYINVPSTHCQHTGVPQC
mgnify:CR=1 FL=1